MTVKSFVSARGDGDMGGMVMRHLEATGWEFNGGYGVELDPVRGRLWGWTFIGPNGETAEIAFCDKGTGAYKATVLGVPLNMLPDSVRMA